MRTTHAIDPIQALTHISADELRDRLHALDAERRALLTLLRAAAARERAAARRATRPAMPEEAPHV